MTTCCWPRCSPETGTAAFPLEVSAIYRESLAQSYPNCHFLVLMPDGPSTPHSAPRVDLLPLPRAAPLLTNPEESGINSDLNFTARSDGSERNRTPR